MTKEIIVREYNRKKEYIDTQYKKINNDNVLSIFIETIKELDYAEHSNSDYFQEIDLLEVITILCFKLQDEFVIDKYVVIEDMKESLYNWMELSKEQKLENIECPDEYK